MAVVMKATKLDELFGREGGVSQVFKKNYISTYTVSQHRDLGTGQQAKVTDTDLPLTKQHISKVG